MARIRSLSPTTQVVRPHSTEVDCEYVLLGEGRSRVLHLSTFGSDQRESKRKSSQSFQIDLTIADELLDIIYSAFPELWSIPGRADGTRSDGSRRQT